MRTLSNLALAALVAGVLASSAVAKDGFFVGANGGYDFSSKLMSKNAKNHLPDVIEDEDIARGINIGDDTGYMATSGGYNFGLKAGYDLGVHRFYGGYSYGGGRSYKTGDEILLHYTYTSLFYNFNAEYLMTGQTDTKWNEHKLVLGYESRIPVMMGFKAVVGVNFGVAFLNVDSSSKYVDKSIENDNVLIDNYSENVKQKSTNFLFGANLGVAYEFAQRHEVDFGVRFEKLFNAEAKVSSRTHDADLPDLKPTKGEKYGVENFGLYVGYSFKF